MRQLPYRSSPSLLTRIVGGLIAVTTLLVGLTVGFALFLILLGLAAIAIVAFYLRLYWLRRKFQRYARQRYEQASHRSRQDDAIEGEYEEIRRRRR